MEEDTPIDVFYKQYCDTRDFLTFSGEASLLNDYTNAIRKMFILCCASYYEDAITRLLIEYVHQTTDGDERLKALLKKKAIGGKNYHTLFDWGTTDNPDKPNKTADTFWGLFGSDFKQKVKADIGQEQTECGKGGEQVRKGMAPLPSLANKLPSMPTVKFLVLKIAGLNNGLLTECIECNQ